jgi:hypothetical protein
VKANQKTLHRQIRSQFQGKRHIPFVATDHEISHGRDIIWTLRAKQAPEHIRQTWSGTSLIVEVSPSGTRDGKPFQATHLAYFMQRTSRCDTSLSTTPEALLQLVRERWSNGHAADGSPQPAAIVGISVNPGRHAGGDARHHCAAGDVEVQPRTELTL